MLGFDGLMRNAIELIEDSVPFDEDRVVSALSTHGYTESEARSVIRNFVFGKGLIPRAVINVNRLGLVDVRVDITLSPSSTGKAEQLLSLLTEDGYLISWGKSIGLSNYRTINAVPRAFLSDYRKVFDSAVSFGKLRDYQWFETETSFQYFSPDPSVFDFRTGNWKSGAGQVNAARRLKETPTTKGNFDALDLRILLQLRKTAAQTPEALALSVGLSGSDADEVAQRINRLRKEKFITSVYLDFFEAGFLAPSTAMIDLLCRSTDNSLSSLEESLLTNPYLSAANFGVKALAGLFTFPLSAFYRLQSALEKLVLSQGGVDSAFMLISWFESETFKKPDSISILASKYDGSHWAFDADRLLEHLKQL
ncbi:MAG: AsnC family protein [TACK group archaeon]|nr:AsnC family protein [TACK group archaeon]